MTKFMKCLLGNTLEEELGILRSSVERRIESRQSDNRISAVLSEPKHEVELRDKQIEIHQSEPVVSRGHMLFQDAEKEICEVLQPVRDV